MIITARIRSIAKVMFSAFLSLCSQGGGVSRKVHSEHIVATKVLMPMGGRGGGVGVGCPGKCTLSALLLQNYKSGHTPGGVGLGVWESALREHIGRFERAVRQLRFELPSCCRSNQRWFL